MVDPIRFRTDVDKIKEELTSQLRSLNSIIKDYQTDIADSYVTEYSFVDHDKLLNRSLKRDIIKWTLSLIEDHENILYVHLHVVNRICRHRHYSHYENVV